LAGEGIDAGVMHGSWDSGCGHGFQAASREVWKNRVISGMSLRVMEGIRRWGVELGAWHGGRMA
jgi:hypothetical protein